MRPTVLVSLLTFGLIVSGQTVEEDLKVYAEHPRLVLTKQRIRMLRRERDRKSDRWQQFELLLKGNAQFPEPGFARALEYQVTQESATCSKAVAGIGNDLRQAALVFDWCFDALSDAQKNQLASRLKAEPKGTDYATVRNRALAAIALADHAGFDATPVLTQIVKTWWRQQVAPELESGKRVIDPAGLFALLELLHAIRDNTGVDLRENAPKYFKQLPAAQLLSYYPATYPTAENDFRIPAFTGKGEPDLRIAALSRIAELAIVAYDNNATESQFLQGWLLHDRFALRAAFGAPYEFLWANPYQPGLSFFHMPLRLHDTKTGRLFLRSTWEEDASWLGYFDRQIQYFEGGQIKLIALENRKTPVAVGDNVVMQGKPAMQFKVEADSPANLFILGLQPGSTYRIEVDDEELNESSTDPGGVLSVPSTRKDARQVRIRSAS
jgi:hypothetical protein